MPINKTKLVPINFKRVENPINFLLQLDSKYKLLGENDTEVIELRKKLKNKNIIRIGDDIVFL